MSLTARPRLDPNERIGRVALPRIGSSCHGAALVCAALLSPPAIGLTFGRVAVNFEIDVQISWRDTSGAIWNAHSEAVSKLPRPEGEGAVETVVYESTLFRWKIRAESDNFGYEISARPTLHFVFDSTKRA